MFWQRNKKSHKNFILKIKEGAVINGCLEQDDEARELENTLKENAIDFSSLWEKEEMPVIKFEGAFTDWLNKEASQCDQLRKEGHCTLPWVVLNNLSEDQKRSSRLYWSQGSLGSCMGHADAFAHHSATLSQIGRGVPFVYESFNPVVTWAITKGGSLWGGQTVSEMADGANKLGHYPERLVGENNQRLPDYREHQETAKKYQSALSFLPTSSTEELAEAAFLCCRAGLAVAYGQSRAVNGAKEDKNGIKVATLGGSWAHATHVTAFRIVNGTEYVFWVNSHGARYGQSEEGEPADGAWMDKKTFQLFMSGSSAYGAPYVVLPEIPWKKDDSLLPPWFDYPKTWKK